LAKILRWGSFKRVSKPLYYRLDHPRSFSNEFFEGSDNRQRAAWATIFTGLLEAVMPLCRTPEERVFFQKAVLYQLIANPTMRPRNEAYSPKKLIAECLERLSYEGNSEIFNANDLAPFIQQLHHLPSSPTLSRTRKGIYKIRQRSHLARIIFPRSRARRAVYQIRFVSRKIAKLVFGSIRAAPRLC
jgi:hypothetical protein